MVNKALRSKKLQNIKSRIKLLKKKRSWLYEIYDKLNGDESYKLNAFAIVERDTNTIVGLLTNLNLISMRDQSVDLAT